MPKRERESTRSRGYQPTNQRKPERNIKRQKGEDQEFRLLDDSIPEESRRMQQRYRAIAKGKNTVGYDEYTRQVPKLKRRIRNPEHPMTPDHKRDIPNRRWLGLVKAWRKSLHKYDPEDLQSSFKMESDHPEQPNPKKEEQTPPLKLSTPRTPTIQDQQLAEASSQGLLVDLKMENDYVVKEEESSTDKIDVWENSLGEGCADDFIVDEDSDDDLL